MAFVKEDADFHYRVSIIGSNERSSRWARVGWSGRERNKVELTRHAISLWELGTTYK